MGLLDRIKSIIDESAEVSEFDDVKDQFQFTGFTEVQKETILEQLEQVWETKNGQEMLQAGLNGQGLHYQNINSQSVIETVAPTIGYNVQDVADIGNFALQTNGEVYLNGYDAIDVTTGVAEVYTNPALVGQFSTAKDPISSLNEDGTVFTVPPIYTLIHETSHTANNVSDLTNTSPFSGKYYSGPTINDTTIPADYIGPNETATREILEQLGIEDFRGAYTASTALDDSLPGTDFGLGQGHEVAVTTYSDIDMSTHAPVDSVVVSATLAELQALDSSFTATAVDNTFRLGNGNDTIHTFDGNDTLTLGGGNDRGFGGVGDDRFISGRGLDYYDGGEANLTSGAASYESDGMTNWGIDTVDYSTFPAGKAAGLLTSEFSADGLDRDGILLRIDGHDALVLKGNAAGAAGEQADRLHNIDIVKGTGRDDLAEVESLGGAMYIDGGRGMDTLRIQTMPEGDEVTNVPGTGTFNGQAFDGYITVGSDTLYYHDYENIELPKEDLKVSTPELSVKEVPASGAVSDVSDRQELPMEEALTILRDESEKALELSPDANNSVNGMLNTPAGVSVMETLINNEQTSVPVSSTAMNGNAYDRVEEVLRGSTDRLNEIGKTHEAEARFNELQDQNLSLENASQDYSPNLNHTEVLEDEMSYSL